MTDIGTAEAVTRDAELDAPIKAGWYATAVARAAWVDGIAESFAETARRLTTEEQAALAGELACDVIKEGDIYGG